MKTAGITMTYTARIANGVRAVIEKVDIVSDYDEQQILLLERETGEKQWVWHIDVETFDPTSGEWESAMTHRVEYAPTAEEAIVPWVEDIREEFER